MFAVCLFLIHLATAQPIRIEKWARFIFGVQGTDVGILGAEHTWFITPLLICYVITPLLDRVIKCDRPKYVIAEVTIAAFLQPLLWLGRDNAALFTMLSLVSWYLVAFIAGKFFQDIKFSKNRALVSLLITGICFGLRLAGKFFFDDTIIYNRVICGYTHFIAALCITYFFAFSLKNNMAGSLIQSVVDVSFEVYLIHYMFCVGPISIFRLFQSWVFACIVVTSLTLILAFGLHKIANRIIYYQD